jgi:hypothetical protein
MKLSTYVKVKFLIELRLKLLSAMDQSSTMLASLEDDTRNSSDNMEGINDTCYWGTIAQHNDGSGASVELGGCYIIEDVVASTLDILNSKLELVENELGKLGVDVD